MKITYRRWLPVLLAFATGALGVSTAVTAAASGGTDIGSGIVILGATVTCPGQPARSLDSTKAAAFMQTWLPYSIFGHAPDETPPSQLAVCHLRVADQWQSPHNRTLIVYYATDGTDAWVGMPSQDVADGVYVSKERWIRSPSPQQTRAAFEGHGKLIPVAVPSTTTAATTTTSVHSSTGATHQTSATPWIVLAAIAILVGALGVVLFRYRRTRTGGHTDAATGSSRN